MEMEFKLQHQPGYEPSVAPGNWVWAQVLHQAVVLQLYVQGVEPGMVLGVVEGAMGVVQGLSIGEIVRVPFEAVVKVMVLAEVEDVAPPSVPPLVSGTV